ncbi:GNAT family N-acetyltransferase [Lysobacter korlensis]|uniref:GNAT family N-acetyltransferase n=1 Tax=Lysobacter korlensis TaxID=553636 RepID=A0ABV6RMI3_9GAMM
MPAPNLHIRVAPVADIPSVLLYEILRLRVEVFVVEQRAAYPEIDGRDIEPGALLLWASDDDGVLGTARLLHDQDGVARIGRVATAPRGRGAGIGAALMRRALELRGEGPTVLDAQEHLAGWYGRFGFTVSGPAFVEDDIPHVPMRRER